MRELKERIHDDKNGLDYVLCGDYYILDLKLQEEHLSIGRWGTDAPGIHQRAPSDVV